VQRINTVVIVKYDKKITPRLCDNECGKKAGKGMDSPWNYLFKNGISYLKSRRFCSWKCKGDWEEKNRSGAAARVKAYMEKKNAKG